jgi:hypothetical protein
MLAPKDFAGGHYTSMPHHGIRAFLLCMGRQLVHKGFIQVYQWFKEHQYLIGGE